MNHRNVRRRGTAIWTLVWPALLFAGLPAYAVRAEEDARIAPPPAEQTAAVIPIHGEITDVMVESVRRRIADAQNQGARVLIFELDTPGGLVTSSIAIADAIKNLKREGAEVQTIAWVNPNAHSGGAIVAVACDQIVMARSSRIGDSQVIMGGPSGMQAVPEDLQPKAYTPVLAEFRASARLNGYDQVLSEAFVIPEREVWWLENTVTGRREFVFRDEKIKRIGSESAPAVKDAMRAAEQADGPEDATSVDAEGPEESATTDAQSARRGASEWKLVETYYDVVLEMEVDAHQPVVRDDQLLEMSAAEATAYGFCKGIVTTENELRTHFSLSGLVRLNPSWSESLAYWLTSIYVRGFLLLIIMLGAYVEFHTPGVGVPGLVALICLAIFVGAPYLTGVANIWEIMFIVIGFILIGVEIFVIPGFGIAGISGFLFLIIGLLATFVPPEPGRTIPLYLPSLPSTVHALKVAVTTVVTSMAASLLGMIVLSRYLPRTPLFSRFAPANPTPSQVAVDDPYRGAARVGDIGETAGPLHPAGKAHFGPLLVDVVTEGEYIDGSVRVEVIERRGNRVVVRVARA